MFCWARDGVRCLSERRPSDGFGFRLPRSTRTNAIRSSQRLEQFTGQMDPTLENMQYQAGAVAASSDVLAWTKILARYREPSRVRSVTELVITIVPLVLLWVLIWAALDFGYWFGLLLAVPAAGLLVRLFMIQHDCGHGAFFRHRLANDWVGRVLGVLTLTPYDFWRRTHAIHHASSGNLDQRGIGDIDTLTVREYLALSRWGRLRYRAGLFVHSATSAASGLDAPRLAAVAQHHGDQRRHRGCHRYLDMVHRHRLVPAGALADHAAGGVRRGLAVLRPAPVRGYVLGRGPDLERACRRASRQLALRSAGRIALVLGQYRRPPRPPPLQPNSLLSPARRAARAPGARGHGPAHPHREPAMRTARAVGRAKAAPHILSRDG